MLSLILVTLCATQVFGHGFIQKVTIGGKTSKAQKTDIKGSSFRAVPDNTGWIGSNFLDSDCTICGCSDTPFGTIKAPGGKNFADAGQSAGQTPKIAAGESLTMHVAGEKGKGWPHPTGHMQVYLGSCGDSCEDLDVRNVKFFKIQSLKDGIPAMKAAFDRGADSNPWPVEIPSAVPSGKYIMRSELIAYGQSGAVEGKQTQIYPFCSNLEVTGGGDATPKTVSFPDVYANDDKINDANKEHVPGPEIDAAFGGSGESGNAGDAAPSSKSKGSKSQKNQVAADAPAAAQDSSAAAGETESKATSSKSKKKCSSSRRARARRALAHHRRHHAARDASW